MVWRYGGGGVTHKVWSESIQWFLTNLIFGPQTDGQWTDDGRLRHDSSSADKVKESKKKKKANSKHADMWWIGSFL